MTKKYVQPGEQLEFTAGSNLLAGAVVVVGQFVGVVENDVLSGAKGIATVEGVFEFVPIPGDVAGLTNGVKAYWNAAASQVSDNAADVAMGWVFGGDAVTGSVKVKLAPSSSAA